MTMEEIEEVIMEETSGESQIGDDFYETIEAPKFIDLTAPDHRPIGDDRYWFCARVGCDQKHEEDMDSEAIYKDFVLRVMAARSPSVRLRKAFCRKDSSTHPKCPNTVPPKPSRSRISKLAMISSIPQKAVDKARLRAGRVVSIHKHSTPKVKGKGEESSLKAKAFTTPGKQKKQVPDPGSFRSVQNPKTAAVRKSKNRVVAKALVFHSPKRTVKLKRSVELSSSMKKICNGMRKLEIANKRNVLGFDHKPVPSDPSRKLLKVREVKSRVFDSLHAQKQNGDKAKCPGSLKKRVKEEEEEVLVENNSKDLQETMKSEDTNSNVGESDPGLKVEPRLEETKDPAATKKSELEKAEQHEASQAEEHKDNALVVKCNEKENVVEAEINDKANEGEVVESDDKENASASDNNRKADHAADPLIKRKAFAKKETRKTDQKVPVITDKCSNGKAFSAGMRAQGVKYTKPKPTNPKPFRLRTDERRILKEANTEKKHHRTPAEETTHLLGSNAGNSRSKHEITVQLENRTTPRIKACNGSSGQLRRHDASDQGENSERAKPLIRKRTVVSQGAASSGGKKRTLMKTPTKGLLEAVKQTAPTILEEAATVKPCVGVASGEKRPATVPRGPHFHSIHIPKSCTKRLVASEV